jgi:hypothetical protein
MARSIPVNPLLFPPLAQVFGKAGHLMPHNPALIASVDLKNK